MDANIPSCHDQAGLNSDSNNAISLLLIFCVFIKIYLNFLFLAPYESKACSPITGKF